MLGAMRRPERERRYATLVNPGRSPTLIGASEVAAAEIHESYQESGMMMMRPVKKLDVPAGKKVELKPGGYHIMLLNLKRDLKAGTVVKLTLQFQNAGKIPVNAEIR
jgi:copper(I)-binding protein